MHRLTGLLVLLLLVASPVFAAEWQFPVRINDSQDLVKEKLGEPDDVFDWGSKVTLFYKARGFEIGIDSATQMVDEIEIKGEAHPVGWGMYEGPIIGGMGVRSNFTETQKVLGGDYRTDPLDEGLSFRSYSWFPNPDFYIDITFWEKDDQDEAGKVRPVGSIYYVKIFKIK